MRNNKKKYNKSFAKTIRNMLKTIKEEKKSRIKEYIENNRTRQKSD